MLDLRWLAATPTPSPTPTSRLSAEAVTPGVEGFLVMAVIAIVIVLLGMAMLRRVRRAQYRVDVREQLDAEEAAARAEASGTQASDAPADDAPAGDAGDVSPGSPAKD